MAAYLVGDEIVFDHEIVGDVTLEDIVKTAKTVVDAGSEVAPKVANLFKGPEQPAAQPQRGLTGTSAKSLRAAIEAVKAEQAAEQKPAAKSFSDIMNKKYLGLPLWGLLLGGAAASTGLYLALRRR